MPMRSPVDKPFVLEIIVMFLNFFISTHWNFKRILVLQLLEISTVLTMILLDLDSRRDRHRRGRSLSD
jgi:hypothetical protein